ncbi:MAG: hypothetical protein HQL06_09565 [Nitrospirae bacterium]|nr:hypothetical protein [Nitrospirota bacterium]
MADYNKSMKKPYVKAIVLAVASIALYTVLLIRQEVINDLFSRGGLYTLLPNNNSVYIFFRAWWFYGCVLDTIRH